MEPVSKNPQTVILRKRTFYPNYLNLLEIQVAKIISILASLMELSTRNMGCGQVANPIRSNSIILHFIITSSTIVVFWRHLDVHVLANVVKESTDLHNFAYFQWRFKPDLSMKNVKAAF